MTVWAKICLVCIFRNTNLNSIYLEKACKKVLACPSSLIYSYTYNLFHLANSTKRQLAELPTILDSFTSVSQLSDYIGLEVMGSREPWSGRFFHPYKPNTARWSHLRPVWALDITNSSQFDGQALWPVMWQFPAGGYLSNHTTAIWRSPEHSSMSDRPEK